MKILVKDFAGYTTFHGLGFIVLPGSSLPRRLLWTLLFGVCMLALTYQIVDRVIYFYDRPVTVNSRTIYNSSLKFPAVTICNLNKHKASKAAAIGMYEVLNGTHLESTNISTLDLPENENVTFEEVMLKTAHSQEDFIHRCHFAENKCSKNDFNTTITDHGVCYTFNGDGQAGQISLPGVYHGLQLTLNVEEYEYFPSAFVGVKMLLHEAGDIPLVEALGHALPAGEQNFIGIKTTVKKNLPEPYGVCENKKSPFYETYTISNCLTECRTKQFVELCGCQLHSIPGADELKTKCTLRQYLSCMKNVTERLKNTHCHCPVPCSLEIHDPDISYASISDFALDKMVTTEEKDILHHNLIDGKEIMSRKVELYLDRWRSIVDNFKESCQSVYLFLSNFRKHNFSMRVTVQQFIRLRSSDGKKLQRDQTRVNLISNAVESLSKIILPIATPKFLSTIEGKIRNLANKQNRETYEYMFNMLTEVKHKIADGMNYTASPNAPDKQYLERDMNGLDEEINNFIDLTNEAYYNHSINESSVSNTRQTYKLHMDNFLSHISTWRTIVNQLNESCGKAIELSKKSIKESDTILKQISSMRDTMYHFKENVERLHHVQIMVSDYFHSNVTKFSIVNTMISQRIQVLYNELRVFPELREKMKNITKAIFPQIDYAYSICLSRLFVEYKTGEGDISYLLQECNNDREYYLRIARRFVLPANKLKRDTLQDDFSKLIESSKEYKRSLQINNDLIRKNFLQVNIFYRSIGYEAVDQQKAYNHFALLCDIGGSMGLLIGGSVLSLFEILDLMIRQIYLNRRKRSEEEKRNTSDEDSSLEHWKTVW